MLITLEQVDFFYRAGQPVLEQVSLTLQAGEFVSIIGGNGSGKSTLARLMAGLQSPGRGRIRKGENVWVGIVFQHPDDQFITTTVEDEIVFGMENIGLSREEMHARLHEVLRAVEMEEYRQAQPHRLSGGQKQRVAIAAVLAMRPQMIIFDEATSMLDAQGRQQMMYILQELHRQGVTLVQITHHMDEVLHAQRVLVLHHGRVAFDGLPSEAFRTLPLAEYGLQQPFAARLQQALGIEAAIGPDWKELIRTQWHTD